MNSADEVTQRELQESKWAAHATEQSLLDMTAAWNGARTSGDQARAELAALREEVAHLETERRHFQEVVDFLARHVAAVHEALDLSYEAETDVVLGQLEQLKKIKRLARIAASMVWSEVPDGYQWGYRDAAEQILGGA